MTGIDVVLEPLCHWKVRLSVSGVLVGLIRWQLGLVSLVRFCAIIAETTISQGCACGDQWVRSYQGLGIYLLEPG